MLPISSASPSHFPPNIGAGLSQALVLIILSEPCGCQEPQSDQEPALGVLGLKYKSCLSNIQALMIFNYSLYHQTLDLYQHFMTVLH